jgi:hypothetical protein
MARTGGGNLCRMTADARRVRANTAAKERSRPAAKYWMGRLRRNTPLTKKRRPAGRRYRSACSGDYFFSSFFISPFFMSSFFISSIFGAAAAGAGSAAAIFSVLPPTLTAMGTSLPSFT